MPTASLPITPIAESTARSGPMTIGERGKQLRDVLRESVVVDGQLAEPEVDHPRRAVAVDEQIGAPQVAVRDALTPQQRNLFPDAAQQLVAPRLRNPIERGAFDRLVRKEQPVGLDGRRRSAGGACGHRRRAP